MKVNITKIFKENAVENHPEYKFGLKFQFTLEDGDKTTAITNNLGNAEISLKHNYCHFWFPFEIEMPHIDLCAFTALKVISPYVSGSFSISNGINQGVSKNFKKFILEKYDSIKVVEEDEDLISISEIPRDNFAVSFSGGVDSVAVSQVTDSDIPLILTAEIRHPDQEEGSRVDNAPVNMLEKIENHSRKIVVYTDFFFLNGHGSINPYADTYSFTVSSVLLAQHLGIGTILTGDILEAFCWSMTRPTLDYKTPLRKQFESIGIKLDYPCNGVSEIITSKIAHENNLLEFTSACIYGEFQKPCMKCLKCFRKSIQKWALFGEGMSKDEIDNFNNSKLLDRYFDENSGRFAWGFMPQYKFCFSRIEYEFDGKIQKLKEKSFGYKDNADYLLKVHSKAYENRSEVILRSYERLLQYAEAITDDEMETFLRLDWNKFSK